MSATERADPSQPGAQTGQVEPARLPAQQSRDSVGDRPPAEAEPVRGGRGRRTRLAAVLAAVVFFAGPAVAGLAGEQPGMIENRPLTPFPSWSDGWAFFPNLSQWAIDHLPLRNRAVEANAAASEAIFGELPVTAGVGPVILGRDGWLFLDHDTIVACGMVASRPTLTNGYEQLAPLLRDRHVRLVTTVPPDKTSIERDRLPERYPNKACSTAAKVALREQLRTRPPPGYVDLFGPIEQVKRTYGSAYKPQDTHMDDHGFIALATTLAGALDPALLSDVRVVENGVRSTDGDLNLLRGRPGPTTFPAATLSRPGVSTTISAQTRDGVPMTVSVSTSTAAPLFPGRTVVFGDSFAEHALPWLAPFFAKLDLIPTATPLTPSDFAHLLTGADTVVIEVVERTYIRNNLSFLEPTFLAEAARILAAQPARS